jgi:hypothetical protein
MLLPGVVSARRPHQPPDFPLGFLPDADFAPHTFRPGSEWFNGVNRQGQSAGGDGLIKKGPLFAKR